MNRYSHNSLARRIRTYLTISLAFSLLAATILIFLEATVSTHARSDLNEICTASVGLIQANGGTPVNTHSLAVLQQMVNKKARLDLIPLEYKIRFVAGTEATADSEATHQQRSAPTIKLFEQHTTCAPIAYVAGVETPWKVEVSRKPLQTLSLLAGLLGNLTTYLIWSVPLLLLPMWLATRNGLKPLQKISANLNSRNSADLSPTGITTDFIEVKPLIYAIDGLLESMRQKVGRETAFVQEAAHELRTPMAVISAQAHVLKRANDEATRLEAASSLDQAIKRANHLVEQLLVLARLDANEESQWSEVNLAALIGDTLAMLAPKAITKNIELSLEVADELTHNTNEHAIVSIIQNLVSNAIQYIPNNAQINVFARVIPSGIEITVQDSGHGIEKSDLPYIFERFYRGKMHDTPGSGLGLSIVETAVKKLNGTIEVSSSNKGACFTVSLP